MFTSHNLPLTVLGAGAGILLGLALTVHVVPIYLRVDVPLAVGALLLFDQPGLRAEYFALGVPWEGKPISTAIGEPRLEDVSQVGAVLTTRAVFSIRWIWASLRFERIPSAQAANLISRSFNS